MLLGSLRSLGIFVQRWKLHEAIHAIEPVATTLHWHPRVKRHPYCVLGPMSLWHLGNKTVNVPLYFLLIRLLYMVQL